MILSALLVTALVPRQSRATLIPPIDWNNLPYQNQVKEMADGWRAKDRISKLAVRATRPDGIAL
jgi:hypothetical protein